MGTQLRVALLVESSHSFGRRVLQGIAAYANAHGPWTFHHQERAFDDPVPGGLADWKADGVIARVANPRLAGQLRRLRVPVVDVYDENLLRGSFGVVVDHQAVVRLAVDHLRECGFQHLAYTGFPNTSFSCERARLFAEYVAIWGFTPHIYVPPARGQPAGLTRIEASTRRHANALAKWLCRLPKPVGLVACNDMRAQQVLTVCGEHGIAVPDTVGVIGIDNDEVRCDLASPSLSSVDPNACEIGYEAARCLTAWSSRQPRTPQDRRQASRAGAPPVDRGRRVRESRDLRRRPLHPRARLSGLKDGGNPSARQGVPSDPGPTVPEVSGPDSAGRNHAGPSAAGARVAGNHRLSLETGRSLGRVFPRRNDVSRLTQGDQSDARAVPAGNEHTEFLAHFRPWGLGHRNVRGAGGNRQGGGVGEGERGTNTFGG